MAVCVRGTWIYKAEGPEGQSWTVADRSPGQLLICTLVTIDIPAACTHYQISRRPGIETQSRILLSLGSEAYTQGGLKGVMPPSYPGFEEGMSFK